MERLQWWLLLLSAVMFSMSGCASVKEWRRTAFRDWEQHPAHFASARHMAFSVKTHRTPASVTDADRAAAEQEEWWGREVGEARPVMVADASSRPGPIPSSESTPSYGSTSESTPPSYASTSMTAALSTPASGSAAISAPPTVMDMSGRWRGRWVANGAWGERRESDAEIIFQQSGNGGTSRMVLADTIAATGVPEVVRHFGALGTPMNFRISKGEVLARFEDGPAVSVRFTRVGDRLYGRMDVSPSFLMVLERQ